VPVRTIRGKGLDALEALDQLGKSEAVVGFLANRHNKANVPVAQLAFIHEFGSPARNIPARPFFFPGLRNARPRLAAIAKAYALRVSAGERGAIKAGLEALGNEAVVSIRRKLLRGPFVPLKPETIRRKGSSKPLVDTGEMLASIEYRVRRAT